ncbi:hypothetical protein [Amycolatopsis sp. CA-126428]|uniref:hypothetical protein n=1 Tax=Amycolatopsis sp. CA-126428 TaxID=2073158 RepID=UPI0011B04438|nr:hypothetical protein [Amycolatopsis sp. CA-126428]
MSTKKQSAKAPLPSPQEAADNLTMTIVRATAEYYSIEHRRAILAGQAKRRERLKKAAEGARS